MIRRLLYGVRGFLCVFSGKGQRPTSPFWFTQQVLLAIILLNAFPRVADGQVFPVQATTQLAPPYSLYLADYVESGTERLALHVFLSDVARPELSVRFRLRIVGQGITIETKAEYKPAPVFIQGGVPLRLVSTDLAEYFNPNNLNFQGMSRREYEQRGKLPEGVYQFCFEVLEYNRGIKISNTACATAWMILNDPPIVNLPRQDEKLKAQSPQNVILQWTPRHTGSPNSAFQTEYDVTMVEVWPSTRNPNDAILTSPPIYEATTASTTIIYGPAETPLEPGRRYAFRVRARSIAGTDALDLFKNNGYSEVFTFVYGDACDLPTGISTSAISSTRFSLSWDGLFNHTAYKVRYREAGTANWYENSSAIASTEITSLKPGTTYEYQVAATCGFFDGAYTTAGRVKTEPAPETVYSCGVPMETFALDPTTLAGSLKPGDVIQAGDFDVKLVKVSGGNGTFSGEGVIEVPYFNKAKVKTEFTNITVNKDLRMVNGAMNVTGAGVDVIPSGVMDFMDDLTEALDQVDSALNTIEENLPEQFDPNSFVADTLVKVKDGISSVYKDTDGSVVVVDKKGNETRLPAGTSAAVVDESGNGYLVDSKGNIHKTTADVATKAGNREYNLKLTFAANAQAKYGFDAKRYEPLANDYETIKGGYSVAWKAVASQGMDPVTAKLAGTGIDRSKVRFEIGGTISQAPPMDDQQTTTVSVRGSSDGTEEGLLALYTPSDTSKDQVLGKLNVVSYDKISKNLVIVPVNNVALPSGASAESIQRTLTTVYGQAVAEWKVSVASAITVSLGTTFDDGESGLLSNYTGDMKTVINAYGKFQDENTYYLFLVDNPKSGAGALGYMPRGKQAGFIFVSNHKSSGADIAVTMAHELGHGAFNLQHTFGEEKISLPKGTTDNLMDYPSGLALYKYQWDKMRFPDIVVGVFEEDEESESVTVNDIEKLDAFKNPDGTLTFIAISGKPLTIKGKLDQVIFISSDDSWSVSKGNLPLGAITGFTVDGKTYSARKETNTSNFLGYGYGAGTKDAAWYEDGISHLKTYKNVLVGIPCWKNGDISFRVFPTSYLEKNPGNADVAKVHRAEGTEQTMYFLSKYLEREGQGVDVYGQFDTKFTPEDLLFVSEQTNQQNVCGADALYLFNIAYVVHSNPSLKLCMPDALADVTAMLQNQLNMEYQQQQSSRIAAVSTAVQKTPLAMAEERKHYDEVYKEKYKDAYLNSMNAALSRYSAVIAKKNVDDLDDKEINDVISFLDIKDTRGRTCLLRGLSIDVRLKLIKKHTAWTITTLDDKEELMADLVETVPDADLTTFLNFLSANSYEWFWSLYGDLHMSEHERFMLIVTRQVMKSMPADPKLATRPNNGIPPKTVLESPFISIGKEIYYGNSWVANPLHYRSNGMVTVGRTASGPVDTWGNTSYKNYFTGSPFDYVNVEFVSDYQFSSVATGEKIKAGERAVVPAMWAYYVLEKQNDIEDFAALRVVMNAGAAIITVITMEPGALMAVELIANSVDIVVALNEDAILSSDNEALKALAGGWNVVYGAYGAGLITKSVVNGITRYIFHPEALSNAVRYAWNSPQKLATLTSDLYKLLLKLGADIKGFNGRTFFQTLILKAYLEAGILKYSLRLKDDVSLMIAQSGNVVLRLSVQGAMRELVAGKVSASADGATLTLHEISWYDAATDATIKEVVWQFKGVNYASSSGGPLNGALTAIVTSGGKLRLMSNDFFNSLSKLYKNQADAVAIFNYYESKFSRLVMVERGTQATVDGRQELLKLISNYSTRSDLVTNPQIIDAWAFLGQYSNLRVNEKVLANVRKIFNDHLYTNLDDVQKAINSSDNVDELIVNLAAAKTAQEFEIALRDIKTIDIFSKGTKEFTLTIPGGVNSSQQTFYAQVMADLTQQSAIRASTTATTAEKIAASESVTVLRAQQELLERGFLPLDHTVYLNTGGKQGEFDLIFWNGLDNEAEVLVIECKGGTSPLKSRELTSGPSKGKRAQQGSIPEYRDDIIENMRKKAPEVPGLDKTLEKIDDANGIGGKGVHYLYANQSFKADGSIGEFILKEFQ